MKILLFDFSFLRATEQDLDVLVSAFFLDIAGFQAHPIESMQGNEG